MDSGKSTCIVDVKMMELLHFRRMFVKLAMEDGRRKTEDGRRKIEFLLPTSVFGLLTSYKSQITNTK